MSFKIGFHAETNDNKTDTTTVVSTPKQEPIRPKKSLVQVYFEERNTSYSYYNDAFDLKCGDFVWVEGKLEGKRGRVIEVSYNFKIKLSDYKKVIGVADTCVAGEMNFVGPYFISNDGSMPFSQIRTWFLPPENDDDVEYVRGNDDTVIDINDLSSMGISKDAADRGFEYFDNNKVAYIGIDHGECHAIVEGSKPYVVDFTYKNGEVSNLVCDCFCTGACKHEFAVLLTLREIIKHIEKNYPHIKIDNDYLSVVRKVDFFKFAIDSKDTGSFVFG